ncbi:hypothetical protein [Streptomyces sp. NPDC050485]|uniref:hypothetical protein n=1 Tax=Streptomyces sp. NPDC050485 TaxID=3365617 RepID=UPI00378A550E
MAGATASVLTLFSLSQPVLWFFVTPDPNQSAAGHLVTGLTYAPLLAVGPLLAILTRRYARDGFGHGS